MYDAKANFMQAQGGYMSSPNVTIGPFDIGQAGTAGINAQQAMPARAPQVAIQLEILSKEIATHEDLLIRLWDQLGPVLSLDERVEKDGGCPSKEPTCPLASHLSQMAATVARHNRAIQSVLGRLEV